MSETPKRTGLVCRLCKRETARIEDERANALVMKSFKY